MKRLSVGGVTRTCIRSGVRWELEGRVKRVEWVSVGLGKDVLGGKYARVPGQERVLDRGEDKCLKRMEESVKRMEESVKRMEEREIRTCPRSRACPRSW
jgi:hypothetical protein